MDVEDKNKMEDNKERDEEEKLVPVKKVLLPWG